jgi:hypothetical protein
MLRLTLFVTFAAMLVSPAHSDEVWVCSMPEDWSKGQVQSRYWLHAGYFVEIGQPHRSYNVLVDDDVAIVAVDATGIDPKSAGLPTNQKPIIGSTTFAMNRQTGEAVVGYVALPGPNAPPKQGNCREQTAADRDAIWPRGFQGE